MPIPENFIVSHDAGREKTLVWLSEAKAGAGLCATTVLWGKEAAPADLIVPDGAEREKMILWRSETKAGTSGDCGLRRPPRR